MREGSEGGRPPRPRLWSSRAGNVALITAMCMIPLTFVLGMAFDYTLAASRKDKLDGIADAAALGGVTPTQMAQSWTSASTQSVALFNGQAATVSGVSSASPTLSGGDSTAGAAVTRTVTVSYTAQSQNVFAALLGMPTMTIRGTSTATSGAAPNIDFYVLLDTSPSMEIAATTGGIATMVANTPSQGGCAFGCHEANPAADSLGNPGGEDNYALARNLGVTLRLDLVNQATQNLMSVAQTTSQQSGAKYRFGIYTIDFNFTTLQARTSDLAAAQTAAASIAPVEVYQNGCLTQSNCNQDEDSYLDFGLSSVNDPNVMTNPGGGTNNATDSPQAVLFIVSDGVVDEGLTGGSCGSAGRMCAPINTQASWCDAIKARGIRIAFLYTTYNPLPTNGFYNSNVAPFQSQIAADAQACASPGLFFQVNTDGDISAAMTALFQRAVSTARLTK